MNVPLVCRIEGDALLDLKVKFMHICQALYNRRDVDGAMRLIAHFDYLPSLGVDNQVENKCEKCTYPDCRLSKELDRLSKILDAKAFDKIDDALNRIGYLN